MAHSCEGEEGRDVGEWGEWKQNVLGHARSFESLIKWARERTKKPADLTDRPIVPTNPMWDPFETNYFFGFKPSIDRSDTIHPPDRPTDWPDTPNMGPLRNQIFFGFKPSYDMSDMIRPTVGPPRHQIFFGFKPSYDIVICYAKPTRPTDRLDRQTQ